MSEPRFYEYPDLARLFDLSEATLRRRMVEWDAAADPFPAPLPWSRREKRWDCDAVRRWKARRELRATQPVLRAVTA